MPVRRRAAAICALALFAVALGSTARAGCVESNRNLGVARVLEIDASGGPLFGDMTKQQKEDSFLGPKEVVLTFDDGPIPWITKSILDTLERHCTKATFFSVGRMALAYPQTLRDILASGHTLGTHTWSHPLNIPKLGSEKAIDEIERGFAAVALAAGQPIAPFFRFPGLSDSPSLLTHLQGRKVASFTVDVVSNDSYIGDTQRLVDRTIRHTEARNGGIILFHDIKSVTARALPTILSELKSRGFKVVHLKSKHGYEPDPSYRHKLEPLLAKSEQGKKLQPFYAGMVSSAAAADIASLPVESLAPAPRVFQVAQAPQTSSKPEPRKPRTRSEASTSARWSTTVRSNRRGGIFE